MRRYHLFLKGRECPDEKLHYSGVIEANTESGAMHCGWHYWTVCYYRVIIADENCKVIYRRGVKGYPDITGGE